MAFLDTLKKGAKSLYKGASTAADKVVGFTGIDKLTDQIGTGAAYLGAKKRGDTGAANILKEDLDVKEALMGAGNLAMTVLPAGAALKGLKYGSKYGTKAVNAFKNTKNTKNVANTTRNVTNTTRNTIRNAVLPPASHLATGAGAAAVTAGTMAGAKQLFKYGASSAENQQQASPYSTASTSFSSVNPNQYTNSMLGDSIATGPVTGGGGGFSGPSSSYSDPTPHTPLTAWDTEMMRRQRITERNPGATFSGMEGMEGIQNRIDFSTGGATTPSGIGGGSNYLGWIGTGSSGAPALSTGGGGDEEAVEDVQTRGGGAGQILAKGMGQMGLAAQLQDKAIPFAGAQPIDAGSQIAGAAGMGPLAGMGLEDRMPVPEMSQDTSADSIISNAGTETFTGDLGGSKGEVIGDFNKTLHEKTTTHLAENNIGPESIEDSQEQIDFFESIENPDHEVEMKRVSDGIKKELGHADHLADKLTAKATLAGFNEAMELLVNDIKANPDLPAGLARRRMDAVWDKYKPMLLAAQNAYDLAQEALDDINQQVNQALGIYTDAATLRARDRDDMRQQLNMFISSGMIGGMTDGEIDIYAQKAGVPPSMLQEARELAKSDKAEDAKRMEKLQQDMDIALDKANAPASSTTSTGGTATERATQAAADIATVFVPGARYDGNVILDSEGYVSPSAWTAMIADAPSEGLSRKQFIEMFGHMLKPDKRGNVDSKYKLTAKEQRLITG